MGKNSEISISIYYILKSCPIGRPVSGAKLNEIAHLLKPEPEIAINLTEHEKIQTYLRCSRFAETPEGFFVKAQKLGKSWVIAPDESIEKFILYFKTKEDFEELLNEIDLEKVRKKLKESVLLFLNKKTYELVEGMAEYVFFETINLPKLGDKECVIFESIQ